MNNYYRRLVILLALGIAGAGFGLANTITLGSNTITQDDMFVTSDTDVTFSQTAQTFLDFLDAAAEVGAPAGSTLNSVFLQESINETITGLLISYTNSISGTSPESFAYQGTAKFTVSGTAPDAAHLNAGLPTQAGKLFTIGDTGVSGQGINFDEYLTYIGSPSPPAGTHAGTIDPTQTGALSADVGNGAGGFSDLTPWTFANSYTDNTPSSAYVNGGNFSLSYTTLTKSTFIGGGGNLDVIQTTTTGADFKVIYNFSAPEGPVAPEPASMFLMSSALFGLGLLRKRFKKS